MKKWQQITFHYNLHTITLIYYRCFSGIACLHLVLFGFSYYLFQFLLGINFFCYSYKGIANNLPSGIVLFLVLFALILLQILFFIYCSASNTRKEPVPTYSNPNLIPAYLYLPMYTTLT